MRKKYLYHVTEPENVESILLTVDVRLSMGWL